MAAPFTRMRRDVIRAALASVLLLCGCSNQELYSQLSERQANDMVAVLRSAGIEADKHAHDGRFAVTTAARDFPQAVRTLNAQGYPRETFDTIGQVFRREGFVSSPLEERARLVHAMSQEISNTLARIDGVVAARVHLVMPERHPLVDKVQPSAAAVFIKHRPGKDLSSQVTQIKALVVNSVEGLSYDGVTVALFVAEGTLGDLARPDVGANAAASSSASLPLLLGAAGAGLVTLAGATGLWWRRRAGTARAPAGSTTTRAAVPQASFAAALQQAERKK
jgi:type III secretion protein J